MIKKRILFAGAGPSQTSAIIHANTIGYETYAIDENIESPGFKHVAAYDVGNIRDHNFIINCAIRYKVDAIVAFSTDVAVPSVARACEVLNFPSISVAAADISVNKLLQRNQMQKAGLVTPIFRSFNNKSEALKGSLDIGFPLVIKPADASGSRGVKYIKNISDLNIAIDNVLSFSPSKCGILEQYIDGSEISVEGFVVNGNLSLLCISEKLRTLPPYLLDTEVLFPDSFSDAKRKTIIDVANDAIRACGLNNCPLHMELLISKNGPVVVELAARGPGFKVFTDIIPYVTNVDTVKSQIQLALNEDMNILPKYPLKSALIKFISPIPGILVGVDGIDEAKKIPGVKDLEIYVKPGQLMGELRSGSDRIGHIIVLGKNRKELKNKKNQAMSLLNFNVKKIKK